MTTETPTAEPFDAFEQRLSAALATKAATVVSPSDGLDRIHARVAHRRRTRRATWFAAAAALVVIAGFIGIALRPTDSDSSPYVDTETNRDTGGMPLLGFRDQAPNVTQYFPGSFYVVADDATLDDGVAISFVVWRVDTGYEPVTGPLMQTSETEVAGQPATQGVIEVDGRRFLAVQWAPAPGHRAMLAFDGASVEGDDRATLADAAARISDVDQATFASTLGGQLTGYTLPPLVPARGTDEVEVLEVRPGSRLTLTYEDVGSAGDVIGLQVLVGGDRTDYGERVVARPNVRGQQAELLASEDPAEVPFLLLRWPEAGRTYQLRVPRAMSTGEAVAIADGLRRPTDEEWRALLFPSGGAAWRDQDWFTWL